MEPRIYITCMNIWFGKDTRNWLRSLKKEKFRVKEVRKKLIRGLHEVRTLPNSKEFCPIQTYLQNLHLDFILMYGVRLKSVKSAKYHKYNRALIQTPEISNVTYYSSKNSTSNQVATEINREDI